MAGRGTDILLGGNPGEHTVAALLLGFPLAVASCAGRLSGPAFAIVAAAAAAGLLQALTNKPPTAPTATPSALLQPLVACAEFMARLKLRELLMPEVVSQVDLEGSEKKAVRVNKVRAVPAVHAVCDEHAVVCCGARFLLLCVHVLPCVRAAFPAPGACKLSPCCLPRNTAASLFFPPLQIKSWAVSASLFPCDLSDEAKALCQGEPSTSCALQGSNRPSPAGCGCGSASTVRLRPPQTYSQPPRPHAPHPPPVPAPAPPSCSPQRR